MENGSLEAMILLGLAVLTGLSCALYGWGLLKSIAEKKQLVVLEDAPLSQPLWVCIPARNEADRLPQTLATILADPSPQLQVFVADDGSEDDTAALVQQQAQKDPRLRLIKVPPTKAGKPGALAALVQTLQASKDELPHTLLFLDADMHVKEGFFGGLQAALQTSGAHAISGAPKLICKSFWEALLVPAIAALAASLYPPSGLRTKGFLNGQIILIRTDALTQVGGWSAVENEVLEDVALARLLVNANLTIRLVDLQKYCATRMYTNLPEIITGFAKNYVALTESVAKGIGLACLGVVASGIPWLYCVAALYWHQDLWGALGLLVFITALQGVTRQHWNLPVWPVFFVPLTALGVLFIALKSSFHVRTQKPIKWRGRDVTLNDPESTKLS